MKLLSPVRLLVNPWTAAYQAPPSMVFSRQEYWNGVPLPSPGTILGVLKRKKKEWWGNDIWDCIIFAFIFYLVQSSGVIIVVVVVFLPFFHIEPHILMGSFFPLINEGGAFQPRLPCETHLSFIGNILISNLPTDPTGQCFQVHFHNIYFRNYK